MRKILIIGAGQSGLQLALSLNAEGYDVTVMSARTPEEIRNGRVMSTQVIFGPNLRLERERGLNQWERETPRLQGLNVTVAGPPGDVALTFQAPFDEYAQSVDQRVKMAAWLELFESRGGKVIHHSVMTSELEELAAQYEVTIIAAGKGELVELFDRDASRSPFDRPQRTLAVVYVHGMAPRPGYLEPHVGINVTPGVGELFVIPAYTISGPCDIFFWEAVPDGPLDRWERLLNPHEHLARSLELMREYVPWEYERCAAVEPTDARSALVGAYTPVVRHPVGEVSATTAVLGMADVVVANDPIAGQGANNAARCAAIYLQSILARGTQPFDRVWMQQTFDAYWDYARHSTNFSNALLGPLPEHVQKILGAATQKPAVAHRFADGYANPTDFENWLMDPAKSETYLASLAGNAR
jgi:2-polyprenyl-6-methoxyphenol hydroxylase-like FAD-dependent oxidoreductase